MLDDTERPLALADVAGFGSAGAVGVSGSAGAVGVSGRAGSGAVGGGARRPGTGAVPMRRTGRRGL